MSKLISPGWCGSVVECQSADQRVPGLIPSVGHMPGLQARSPLGGTGRGNYTFMFLSFSPSRPLSKNK